MWTAKKRPQLDATELRQVKWLLGGALALLAVWAVFYLDLGVGWLAGAATVAIGAALAWPALPARVPGWAWRLAVPAIIVFAAADYFLRAELLPAMIRLALLLLLYRAVSYRRKRDELQLIVLGLFLVVVTGVLTVSLAFAAQILLFAACALALLLAVTLGEETERAGGAAAGGVPAWVAHVSWPRLFARLRAVTDWRLVGLGGALFAGLVALSAGLFLAIPRFELESSWFLDRFVAKKARTGFTDSIRFGDVTDIMQDNSVALRVEVSDPAKIPALPYWRMVALDEYRDGVFRMSRDQRVQMTRSERTRATVRGSVRPGEGAPVYWTFYLEAGVSRFLPLAGNYAELRLREPLPVQADARLDVVALRNDPAAMTAYRVTDLDPGDRLAAPADFPRELARSRRMGADGEEGYPATMLELPPAAADREFLRRTAAEITRGETLTAEEFAARTCAWLARRHRYSLQMSLPAGAGDPLVRWMRSAEPGHCELFAGAFALLARTAGWPARIVTGFKGGAWNAFENYFMVRDSNAHAWDEIYDDRGGWRRVDPTPGAEAADAAAAKANGEAVALSRADRSWAARWDSLRILWYRRIVSFDQRTQAEALRNFKATTENLGRELRAALTRAAASVRAWLAAPWNLARAARGAAAVGVITALGWLLRWAARQRWRLGAKRRHGGDPVRREAGRWLARLRRLEAENRTGGGGEGAETGAEEVIRALERLRFGARENWPEPAGVFRDARRWAERARRERILGGRKNRQDHSPLR